MTGLTAYLAGPDVFFPGAAAHAARKARICGAHGIHAHCPADGGIDLAAPDAARRIYRANRAMMLASDIVIANLTPFRGPSADDGTAFEVGFFAALERPVFAYTNAAGALAERTRRFLAMCPDPFAVEGFGLPCNLMLPHAALDRGGLPVFTPADGTDRPFDDLDTFARLVAAVAARHAAGLVPGLAGVRGPTPPPPASRPPPDAP